MNKTTLSREERIRRVHDTFISLMWVSKRQLSLRLQSYGLTYSQFTALAALAAHQKPCAMRDLTEATLQDPPTMTGVVDRLLKMKLVHRTRSETDRRVVLVQVSPQGIELFNQIETDMLKDAADYNILTDEELEALEQLSIYILRIHLGKFKSPTETDIEAEIEKLRIFKSDPIGYAKLEREKQSC